MSNVCVFMPFHTLKLNETHLDVRTGCHHTVIWRHSLFVFLARLNPIPYFVYLR